MDFTVTISGRELKIKFDEAYGNRTLEVDGQPHKITLLRLDGDRVRFTVDDRPIDAVITGKLPDLVVDVGEGPLSLNVEESRYADIRKISGLADAHPALANLRAPMPGLITRILVEPGVEVQLGTPLLVMEAMKMENELRASGKGIVQEIKVAPKQPVEQGELLITFA